MHDTCKLFSIWCFKLIYSEQMFNRKGAHDLETLQMVIELYLVSNSTTPDPSLSSPSATLRYRLLGNASSHFFPVAPRYSSITGYVCLSACGKLCNHKDDIKIVSKRQQELLTAQSPVCTRITQAVNWTLEGPDLTLQSYDDGFFPPLIVQLQSPMLVSSIMSSLMKSLSCRSEAVTAAHEGRGTRSMSRALVDIGCCL